MKEGRSRQKNKFVLKVALSGLISAIIAFTIPTSLNDFFLPGSQPLDSESLEGPSKCRSCHGGYDKAVEPLFNWTGSMMAQAQRDPLYLACLAISNQDVPFSGDLCIRCHSPEGWLGDRSTPTDGSLLNDADYEGIHCGFCHRMLRPSEIGQNHYPDDADYTSVTYVRDQIYLQLIDSIPVSVGNGSYVVDSDLTRRGPFTDAEANHEFYYSPFHSESTICGTCHDVSNPAFDRQPDGSYLANDFDMAAPSFYTYDMFPVERTYSEWLMSSYNSETGVYAPIMGGNKDYVSSCQDCHMRDLSGKAAGKPSAVFRNDLPHHDMTGGNTFIPELIKIQFPGVDAEALDSGIVRARYMLQYAATLEMDITSTDVHTLNVKVTNETGHKLPSGYPEGRRIWLNIIARDGSGSVIYESGHYDQLTASLTHDEDVKIYEIKPGMDAVIAGLNGYEEGPSFHFVLNNKIFFDNRIPPRGFTNAAFEAIQSPPVGYTYADGQYWDETEYILPVETELVEVYLLYQTASKEYIEFLKNENTTNNAGQVLYNLWSENGKSAPEVMAYASQEVYSTGTGNLESIDISVYPNPSPGYIRFKMPHDIISHKPVIMMVNASGQVVLKKQLQQISDRIAEVRVMGLMPGRYTYVLISDGGDRIASGPIIIK